MTHTPIITVIGGPAAGKSSLIDHIAPHFAPCTVLDPDRLRGSNEERWDRIRAELDAADHLIILEACTLPADIDALLDTRPSATIRVHVSDELARERLIDRSWSPAHAARAAGQHSDRIASLTVRGDHPLDVASIVAAIREDLRERKARGQGSGGGSLTTGTVRHPANPALKTGHPASVFSGPRG